MKAPFQTDELMLERFVDKFKELSDLSFFRETDPTATEFAVGKDSDYEIMERWEPLRFKTEVAALDGIYARLPARLPTLLEKLLLNFRWAEVDLDLFTLMANPKGNDLAGWLEQISRDKHLWKCLLPAGYIPFGKGADMDYDRVCLDLSSRRKNGEWRILKIDHEEILCHSRVKIVAEVAPSFRALVEKTLAHKLPAVR